MNKKSLSIFMLLLISVLATAQDRSDVFKDDASITWLGLDFTEAKFIGDREKLGSESDLRHLMEAWNQLILNEPDKFDIAGAIGKRKVVKDIQPTLDHNASLDVSGKFTNSDRDYLHLNREGVANIISKYNFKGLKGIGLMFNIESFSKPNEEASMYVTFVDMGSKQVLFTERLTEEPRGFGLRNYWAGAVYGVLQKVRKKEYEMWRKKYAR